MAAPTVVAVTTYFQNAATAQSSWNVPLIQNTTAGSQLVLCSNVFAQSNAYYDINGSSGNPTTNNGDTSTAETFSGNPFVAANSATIYTVLEVYRFTSVTAGSSSLTVNYKNAGNVTAGQLFLQIVVFELSGMGATQPDQVNDSALAATQSIGVTTAANAGDLFIGFFDSGAGSQSGAGWTNPASTILYYQSQPSNATVTFTTTGGTDPYVSALIAYAGIGAPPPMPPVVLGRHTDILQTPIEGHMLTRL